MVTRNTNTTVKDSQGNNRTATHLSTHIIVKVDGNVVGALKTLNYQERRDVSKIPEIGTDGFIDSAPRSSTDVSGSATRTRYNRLRMLPAFSRGFIHPGSQRIPFDIEIQDIFADADPANAIITTLENVWVTNISNSYNAEDFVIVDSMDFTCERINSILNSGNVVQSVADGLQFPVLLNQFEQEADRGAFTGALDAAGLLNAFLDDPTL